MSDLDALLKDVGRLADALSDHDLVELEIERDGLRIRVRREGATVSRPAPAHVEPPAAAPPGVVVIRSPLVGTFYRSPTPDAPPFVDVGMRVSQGEVLCLVEAMKLMNEIDAECDGTVETIFVDSGEPVEYGQKLFAIRRSSPSDVSKDSDREPR